ncbi:Stonustoxin subunit alpha, partial [Dissostichus eleginoides]
EAVEVYLSLPKLLGANGENAVPVKVWLLPLTCLDSTAAKLVRQISIGLVQECQSVLEDFSDLEMRFNDALRTQTAQQFPQIGKKLKTFKQKCSQFKKVFQQTLAEKLPSIRGGGEEEAVLAEELRKTCSSPFNSKDLNEWMDCKEREISILKSYTMMKNTQIVPRKMILKKFSKQSRLCVLSSPRWEVMNRTSQLYQTTFNKHPNQTMPKIHTLQINEANKENKNITFLTVGLTNETQKGASIYLYTDGFSVNEDFEPPSKPATVTGSDINHNSVTLKISPPRFGAEDITSYSVEYWVSGEDGWKQKTASKAEEVTVSDLSAGPANEDGSFDLKCLKMRAKSMENIFVNFNKTTTKSLTKEVLRERKQPEISIENLQKQVKVGLAKLSPNTEYMFRCRAETPVGAGPANEVSGSIKTLPCSPPGKLHVESTSREISVSWEKPAELGQDVHVLSYIVEYAKQDQHVKEEDLHWEQMMAGAEKAIISGLQPETEYAVRVRIPQK